MDLLMEIIIRLEAVRSKYATQALEKPSGHESFDYGRACGIYSGLTLAVETINTVIEERDDEDRRK